MLLTMPKKSPKKSQREAARAGAGETVGQRLARLRKERGYTQVALAERIGIIQALVSDYERDKLRLNAEMTVRFAQALEVTADELLGLQPSTGNGRQPSRKVLRRLEQIENLPKRDQDALLRTIDAFLSKSPA
ncbi:MAG: helix-turn-helix domain-containing protein [Pyrinomonadaceae bacterium]